MEVRKAIKRFFGLHKLTIRDLIILLLSLFFLGLLITITIIKLLESTEKYNTKYYDPKDFQREEMIKKKVEKK